MFSFMKSKQKVKQSDPRNLWQIGQELRTADKTAPTEKQIEFAKREWLLRFDVANFLGLSDETIVSIAKERFMYATKGNMEVSTWEKDCPESTKAYYISEILPVLDCYQSTFQITGPAETILIAKLTNR